MHEGDGRTARRSGRRTFLASLGVGLGSTLAGCVTAPDTAEPGPDDPENESRIAQLEAELAETNAENEALRRRLETGNVWGFEEETLDRLQAVADAWTGSVVAIDAVTEEHAWGVGTGWVYDDGVIATNAHVIEPRRLPDGEPITEYTVWDRAGHGVEGTLIGYTYGEDDIFERREDIGLLSVPKSMTDGRDMVHGHSRELEREEPLVQVGHPYSLEFWTAAVGPFLAHREPFFTSDVPGQPGVSGSPVLDLDGEVVGMTWGGLYVRRQRRAIGEPPVPGDGGILATFESAMNGLHSYMHRIDAAAEHLR